MRKLLFKNDIGETIEIVCKESFNNGTRFKYLIEQSIRKLGAGRSIVVDKNNNILNGCKTAEACQECGIKKVRIIETKGDELIIVKRTDIDTDSTKALELSLVDNLIANKNLNYDTNLILDKMNEKISFNPTDWQGYECIVKELDIEDFLKDEVERQKVVKKEKMDIVINNTLSLFD